MLFAAIGFFSLAAILGLILISYVLQSKDTPKSLAFTHGGLAATGIVLLIIYSLYRMPSPIESIILFIIAALSGFILIYRDLTGQSIPKWLALSHGTIAIVGFIALLFFVFV